MKDARYWSVFALLLLAAVTLYRRGDKDHVPPSTPLSQFPETIGPWSGADIPIPQETLDVLGTGFFLNRNYVVPVGGAPDNRGHKPGPVGLFIGYFPTQRTGQSIHSPQNCLPGSGWTFESSGLTDVTDSAGKTTEVGDYVIVNGPTHAEVLYWYQSHGRAVANDYKAKAYMLVDSIRYSRSDAALIRIVTPVDPGESRDSAHLRAVHFAQGLIPLLPAYVPN
jgi:EpsI family protein